MTESPKPPPRPAPKPLAPERPPASPAATAGGSLTREPARDTLAPSSFGVLGGSKPQSSPAPMRPARSPLPTLGELESATATATLRPPGAVPPPPRGLPVPSSSLEASPHAVQTPVPRADRPFTPLAGDLPLAQRSPRAPAQPAAATRPNVEPSLDSTLDMSESSTKKATHAALLEQTRLPAKSAVPAPGLFIADEPLEPRPQQPSLVTVQRKQLTRMRTTVLVLGGLLLMLLGALTVLIFRRSEATQARAGAAAAAAAASSVVAPPPGCRLALPPSRIAPIQRTVPIVTEPLPNGSLLLAIAETKTRAAGWVYDPASGEAGRKLEGGEGEGEISYVTPGETLVVDRTGPEFSFARTLSPGLALGVGPSGILRRGPDGATGVVWPLKTGVRITPPRVGSTGDRHFVAFRQGGAEGQLLVGWLRADGTPQGEPHVLAGTPKTLGTPHVTVTPEEAIVLFPARDDKSEPYRVHAARVPLGRAPAAVQPLQLPAEGGGAIAPSLSPFAGGRFLAQWTDGSVGKYQVHVRLLNERLEPLSEPLQVSAKGANAGQGSIVAADKAVVSFFIQTTAGHDELWGATLSCH